MIDETLQCFYRTHFDSWCMQIKIFSWTEFIWRVPPECNLKYFRCLLWWMHIFWSQKSLTSLPSSLQQQNSFLADFNYFWCEAGWRNDVCQWVSRPSSARGRKGNSWQKLELGEWSSSGAVVCCSNCYIRSLGHCPLLSLLFPLLVPG